MLFHWNHFIESHSVFVPANDEWHLCCMLDDEGVPFICLETAYNRYMVANGFECLHGRENLGLNTSHVSRFYFEVVKEVYNIIESYNPSNIDISAVKANLIPAFWSEWQAKGYISENDDPMDSIF